MRGCTDMVPYAGQGARGSTVSFNELNCRGFAGSRKRQAQAAVGQFDARDRCDARGSQGKIVAVVVRREVVRQLQGLGLSEC